MFNPAAIYPMGKAPMGMLPATPGAVVPGAAPANPLLGPLTAPAARPVIAQGNGPRSDLLAKALLASAVQGGNIETPTELLGRLAQTFAGNYAENKNLAAQKAQEEQQLQAAQARSAAAYSAGMKWLSEGAQGEMPPEVASDPGVAKAFLDAKLSGKAGAKPTPYTDFAKAGEDLRNGLITQQQYDQRVQQLQAGDAALFDGKSVEGQGLNYLVKTGKLTSEQAAEVAAGKTITGPNGEIIFMTPSGIFSKEQGQAQPAPVVPPEASAAPNAINGAADAQRPGMIPLTKPKAQGTEGQMNAALYADRMRASNEIITRLESAGTSLPDKVKSGLPLGNYLVSDEYRQLDQAQRDFVNATLRRESGAVISPQEFDNARLQYFPQPGDDATTIEQKRRNRETALTGISRAAGSNYKPTTAAPPAPLPTQPVAPPPAAPEPQPPAGDTGVVEYEYDPATGQIRRKGAQ